MNSLGKLAGFLTAAIMLAAFALPASAAKTIGLTVPTSVSTTTTSVTVRISNDGNSNANSFEVDWLTSPNFAVESATAGSSMGNCSAPGLKGPLYSRCIFTKQLPAKTFVDITLNVVVSNTNQCAPAPLDWFAYAWTGSPGPVSQSFTLPPGTSYTTKLPSATGCRIEFVSDKQPKDAFIDSTITNSPFDSAGASVSVRLVQDIGTAPDTTIVSVSGSVSGSPLLACANSLQTSPVSGVAEFRPKAGPNSGSCELTASAPGYGSATSAAFQVKQPDGILGCGESTNQVDLINGAQAVGTRLNNTNDGLCGAPIPYVLVWRDPDGKKLEFVKDDLGQAVAMTFNITWPNEAAPTAPLLGDTVPTYGVLGAIKLSQQEFLPGEIRPIDLCVGTPVYVGGIFDSLTDISSNDLSAADGFQYGCVLERDVSYPEAGKIGLKELIYLQGDWGAGRL